MAPGHRLLLSWVSPETMVLEFGPGTGYLSEFLKTKLRCTLTGFEISPVAATQAGKFCDQMIVGDIEDDDQWSQLTSKYDTILFGDTLEHLRNPAGVLVKACRLLKPAGQVLISIPNVAHWTVRWNLLLGRFDYQSSGLLDDTHLRFFTRRTLRSMIESSGLVIVEESSSSYYHPAEVILGASRVGQFVRRHLLRGWDTKLINRLFPDATTYQFLLRCRLPDDSEVRVPTA